ncbi:MAG: hypothetical protein CFH01_00910 [Alphaproteobacteria bacterium MarineAlpha2_Bin1]|nr:MAG: hypothetical protein CFH01_00910 [Alphaproteobacteria bacterium MarineAlpha2_Bin1]
MSHRSKILILFILIIFAAGFLALVAWDISPEMNEIEKAIPFNK